MFTLVNEKDWVRLIAEFPFLEQLRERPIPTNVHICRNEKQLYAGSLTSPINATLPFDHQCAYPSSLHLMAYNPHGADTWGGYRIIREDGRKTIEDIIDEDFTEPERTIGLFAFLWYGTNPTDESVISSLTIVKNFDYEALRKRRDALFLNHLQTEEEIADHELDCVAISTPSITNVNDLDNRLYPILHDSFPALLKWLLNTFGTLDIFHCKEYDVSEPLVVLGFNTHMNHYHLVCSGESKSSERRFREKGNGNGYLGVQMHVRTAYPNENYLRGKDLADGEYSFETFTQIMQEIWKEEFLIWHKTPDEI